MTVAQPISSDHRSLQAGLLLCASPLLPADLRDALPPESILALTGASKSPAYVAARRIKEGLPQLLARPGRKPAPQVAESTVAATATAVIQYLMENPGAVCRTASHTSYSDGFRRVVLGLLEQDEVHTLQQLAQLLCVPEGTLKGWLKGGLAAQNAPQRPAAPADALPGGPADVGTDRPPGQTLADLREESQTSPPAAGEPPRPACSPARDDTPPSAQADEPCEPLPDDSPGLDKQSADPLAIYARHADIKTILTQYRHWRGDFVSFCDHLRKHHSIGYGRTFIANLLQAVGMRNPRRSPGTAHWSRGTFRNQFPGAHWMGDGTTMAISFNGHWHVFNVQAVVDTASDAILSFKVTAVEDEAAVLDAWSQAMRTANGQQPVMLTLDGKPCNHTSKVEDTIAPAILVRSTPGRGQAKAPVEQKFGLFAQTAPPLRIEGQTDREQAAAILQLVVTTWAWGRNHKPRRRLANKSPAEVYGSTNPTVQQIEAARQEADQMRQRYRRFQETRSNRSDPAARRILSKTLPKLGIQDPDGRLQVALATYSIEAILQGIAIFRAKRKKHTIPPDADRGRYLAGIIRNRHHENELETTADFLLQLRLQHRELCLAPLESVRTRMADTVPIEHLPKEFLVRALEADTDIAYRFYSLACMEALNAIPPTQRHSHHRLFVRMVAASYSTPFQRRFHLIDQLTQVQAAVQA